MALYEVIGQREYRGHRRGEQFEADLDPAEERRAVRRRAIRVIDRRIVALNPAAIRPPRSYEERR